VSGVIRWEDPPRRGVGEAHNWPGIAADLRQRPKQWAIAVICRNFSTAGQTARRIRDGAYKPMEPTGAFEATARTIDGEHRVYARYVGEPS